MYTKAEPEKRKKHRNRTNFSITHISKMRRMWIFVLFDLPVAEKADRKVYSDFRNYLLDEGFQMVQFSVYIRFLSGKDSLQKYISGIRRVLPKKGKVDIISITDRQYENIISFRGQVESVSKNEDKQFLLF